MYKIEEVLYLLKHHKSQRYIQDNLSISRNTIRKYHKLAIKHGFCDTIKADKLNEISVLVEHDVYFNSRDRYKSAQLQLQSYHQQISQYLQCKYMTIRQMFKLLQEQGLNHCSERSLSRYIAKHFSQLPKFTVHLEHKPAQQAQVDYAYVGIHFGKKTYAFIMKLPYSKYKYVEFTHSQDSVSWLQSHINAFEFFNAVPKTIMIDNLKAGVIKPNIYDPVLNPSYADLAKHYNFTIDTAKVRKPQHKGVVERAVQVVKQQLIAGRAYSNLDELNQYTLKWLKDTYAQTLSNTTGKTPYELFIKEQDLMLKVNSVRFDIYKHYKLKVRQDHHITIDGSFYSLPTKYIGLDVDVKAGFDTIKIYFNHRLIKCYSKAKSKAQWITDKCDYPKHISLYLNANKDDLLQQAKNIGEFTLDYIKVILNKPGAINIRKTISVLNLAHSYGNDRLELACFRACSFDNYEYQSLKTILDNNLDISHSPTFSILSANNNNAFLRSSDEFMEYSYA